MTDSRKKPGVFEVMTADAHEVSLAFEMAKSRTALSFPFEILSMRSTG
nr:hypothetical protein [Chryseobacterium takakiae]